MSGSCLSPVQTHEKRREGREGEGRGEEGKGGEKRRGEKRKTIEVKKRFKEGGILALFLSSVVAL